MNFIFHNLLSMKVFDTVDHQLLLRVRILQYRFSINDSALAWFNSYLSDRSQTVHVNSSISRTVNLSCGMPQGSSLGPKTFIAYTEDVDEVFSAHHLDYHSYADDIQSYIHTAPFHLMPSQFAHGFNSASVTQSSLLKMTVGARFQGIHPPSKNEWRQINFHPLPAFPLPLRRLVWFETTVE